MKYKYRAHVSIIDSEGGYVLVPLLQVTLKHGRKQVRLDCLVDSGAADSLFSRDIADALGIDLGNAKPQDYYGIGDIAFRGYISPVQMQVQGFSEWLTVEAGFIDENEIPLLGQSGFFESFEVTFRAYQNRFELKRVNRRYGVSVTR